MFSEKHILMQMTRPLTELNQCKTTYLSDIFQRNILLKTKHWLHKLLKLLFILECEDLVGPDNFEEYLFAHILAISEKDGDYNDQCDELSNALEFVRQCYARLSSKKLYISEDVLRKLFIDRSDNGLRGHSLCSSCQKITRLGTV
ncbi:hypothetical protein GJ496_002081 [Pomphorhynchus laevis]|nr:hypothetical protein GJ496_002081 [Pomphorhynchus laevis]